MCYSLVGWIISGILFMMWKKIEENEEADFCGLLWGSGGEVEKGGNFFFNKTILTVDGIVFFFTFVIKENWPIA